MWSYPAFTTSTCIRWKLRVFWVAPAGWRMTLGLTRRYFSTPVVKQAWILLGSFSDITIVFWFHNWVVWFSTRIAPLPMAIYFFLLYVYGYKSFYKNFAKNIKEALLILICSQQIKRPQTGSLATATPFLQWWIIWGREIYKSVEIRESSWTRYFRTSQPSWWRRPRTQSGSTAKLCKLWDLTDQTRLTGLRQR